MLSEELKDISRVIRRTIGHLIKVGIEVLSCALCLQFLSNFCRKNMNKLDQLGSMFFTTTMASKCRVLTQDERISKIEWSKTKSARNIAAEFGVGKKTKIQNI